ncbi:hypothetical protein EV421DRAFT_1762648, partial [Armillaria borealis]
SLTLLYVLGAVDLPVFGLHVPTELADLHRDELGSGPSNVHIPARLRHYQMKIAGATLSHSIQHTYRIGQRNEGQNASTTALN